MSTASAPGHPDPSGSHQIPNADESESDTESQPRLSALEKGKLRVDPYVSMSEDEPDYNEAEGFRGSVTPTPYTAAGVMFSLIDGSSIPNIPLDPRTVLQPSTTWSV